MQKLRDNQKITLTIGQIRRLIRESFVLEEVYEPKHLVGDLNLPDEEIRKDLETLMSRKVPSTITQNDKKGIGRELIIKYMGKDAIRDGSSGEWFWVEKKDLRVAIAVQLRYNRFRKTEFNKQDLHDFLMLFKSERLPSSTKDSDYVMSKEPEAFLQSMADDGEYYFEDYLRRNSQQKELEGNIDTIISVIEPQLKKWHDEFISNTKDQFSYIYDQAADRFPISKEILDNVTSRLKEEHGEHRWAFYKGSDREYLAAQKDFSRVRWVERYLNKKDQFINEKVAEAEATYQEHLHRVSDKIMNFNVDPSKLEVTFVRSDYWKTFELGVTDGIHNLYARSIWAAEYSEVVTPHFRFIVTDKKSKLDQIGE